MDDDTLPEIAIVGAGPVGIETALYARYLGYPVSVYESGEVCQHVRQWGHVTLFTPFGMNCSPLGLSALDAQFPGRDGLAADSQHTGQQWVDHYLGPLADSDLIRHCLHTRTRVESIGRGPATGGDSRSRSDRPFRLLLADSQGRQRLESAGIVIDATGTWAQANPLGCGGMPAIGEGSLVESLPDQSLFTRHIVSPVELKQTGSRRFVVLGRGYSAATHVLQLNELRQDDPSLTCVWITRSPAGEEGPMPRIDHDALEGRDRLAVAANQLASEASWLECKPETELESIRFTDGQFELQTTGGQTIHADHLIANTGFHGDYEMLDALHIHRCHVSGGPMAWAAAIADSTSVDCLQQKSAGPAAIRTTEANFFIIGSKSYGRDPRFLFATGLQQIRDVFKIIAGRETLDLYATLQPDALNGSPD